MIRKIKSSPIWDYFTDDAKWRATCNACNKTISFKGGSTFNLTRHMRVIHPGTLEGPLKKKAIETRLEEPKDVQVKIESTKSLNRDVILSEVDVSDDITNEVTADADITWAELDSSEPEPSEPEQREPEPKEPEPKKLRQNPLEHFKPSSSALVPHRDINRSPRERSSEEFKRPKKCQRKTPNSTYIHFQNDPIEIFGKSVVAQMRMLPKRQAISTQLKIQAILTEQLLEYEDSKF